MPGIEPILEVNLPPASGQVMKFHQAPRGGAGKLLLVEQVYIDRVAQECIYRLCETLAQEGGIRLITVEGAEGQLQPGRVSSIKTLIERTTNIVSAGVLHFLNAHADQVQVWGVDHMEWRNRSEQEMSRLQQLIRTRERIFDRIRGLLKQGQSQIYPPALASFRAGTVLVHTHNHPGIKEQLVLISQLSAQTGIDLRNYPAIASMQRIMTLEKQISLWRVRGQMAKFQWRIMRKLNSWWKVKGNRVEINLEAAGPVLNFYAGEVGLTQEELEKRVHSSEDLAQVLSECKQWIETQIMNNTAQPGIAGAAGSGAYFEGLMRLALSIGVNYFELADFRKYVVMLRHYATFQGDSARAYLVQLQACVQAMVDCLPGSRVATFFHIEEELTVLHNALALEIPSYDAVIHDLEPGKLKDATRRLCTMLGYDWQQEFAPVMKELEICDNALTHAKNFVDLSSQRGRHMLQTTLAEMRKQHRDRAIIVTGGFHAQAVIQELEDNYPDISWSVIMPQVGDTSISPMGR